MDKARKAYKEPISREKIFKIMLYTTYIVALVFLLKNIIEKSLGGAMSVGLTLTIFTVVLLVMRQARVSAETRQFAVSIALLFLVFAISLFSGDYYSDDYLLYLVILGLTGLYLNPKYTLVQAATADVLLILQFLIHPDKVESTGQFILCLLMFIFASYMFYLTIQRGHAFILMGQTRAEEAEKLLESFVTIGDALKQNFESSSQRIENLKEANVLMEGNAMDLKGGSASITQGARDVEYTCDSVQDRIRLTEGRIDALNGEVQTFETALAANQENMEEMSRQMESVKRTVGEANDVFHKMEEQMHEIYTVLEQLNTISSSTTMLALNASIEAARVGNAGAGFAVVASKVQELAVDRNKCSEQVGNVVEVMREQIRRTTLQMGESTEAIDASLGALEELKDGFGALTHQFDSLYSNIEEQNSNVGQIGSIFESLKGKITDMNICSEQNQASVEAIADAMNLYKDNIKQVIDDTKQIHELSATMLTISREKEAIK